MNKSWVLPVFHSSVLRGRRNLLCFAFLFLASASSTFADYTFEEIGFRVSLDHDDDVNLTSYELVFPIETPWEYSFGEDNEVEFSFEGSAGVLSGEGETGGLFHLIFVLEFEFDELPFVVNLGTGPTIVTEEKFDQFDLGGNFHFTSIVGVDYEIDDAFTVGYQFFHISNAGLEDRNPGLNMHSAFIKFEF